MEIRKLSTGFAPFVEATGENLFDEYDHDRKDEVITQFQFDKDAGEWNKLIQLIRFVLRVFKILNILHMGMPKSQLFIKRLDRSFYFHFLMISIILSN